MELKEEVKATSALTAEALMSMAEGEEEKLSSREDEEEKNSSLFEEEMEEYDEEEMEEYDENEKAKKPKLAKKDYLTIGGMLLAVAVMGGIVYSVFFNDGVSENKEFEPIEVQAVSNPEPIVAKKAVMVKPQLEEIAKPLAVINNIPQQETNELIQATPVKEKPPKVVSVPKIEVINFKAKDLNDVGINQFVLLGDKAFLDSELFLNVSFSAEKKLYNAYFNGQKQQFIKILNQEVYLPSKQVSDSYKHISK